MIRTPVLMLTAVAALCPVVTLAASDALPSRCEAMASRTIAFTSAQTKDELNVTVSGADCKSSIVTVSIRQQDGPPVAAFAVPLLWLNEPLANDVGLTPDVVKHFLDRYVTDASLDVAAGSIPEWKKRDRTPGFSEGLELTSPLDRSTYARLRHAKPNLLCLGDAHEMGVCYVWDARWSKSEIMLRR